MSLEGLMLKVKLQHFCWQMWKADSMGKTLMLGETEGKRRMGGQRMTWFDSITHSIDMNLSKSRRQPGHRAWCATVHGVAKSWTLVRDWTTTSFWYYILIYKGNYKTDKIFHQYWMAVNYFLILPLLTLSSITLYSLNIWISEPPLQLKDKCSIRNCRS